MFNFTTFIKTNHANSKLIQQMVIKEGNLFNFDSLRESKNINYIKSRFLKKFESVYPKLTFLKDMITSTLAVGREKFLIGNCTCFNLAGAQKP